MALRLDTSSAARPRCASRCTRRRRAWSGLRSARAALAALVLAHLCDHMAALDGAPAAEAGGVPRACASPLGLRGGRG